MFRLVARSGEVLQRQRVTMHNKSKRGRSDLNLSNALRALGRPRSHSLTRLPSAVASQPLSQAFELSQTIVVGKETGVAVVAALHPMRRNSG